MAVFLVYVIDLAVHWVEFTSITNIVVRYYGVSPTWVEGTTVVFMVLYAVGVFPALYLMDKLVSDFHEYFLVANASNFRILAIHRFRD